MKNNAIVLAKLLIFVTFSLLLACADEKSPRLMAPPLDDPKPQPKVKGEAKSTGMEVVYNPRVDILFVIDNSRSMKEDIITLKTNIQKFVGAMAQNTVMDYHIGAVTVHDSSRFTNSMDSVFKVDPNDGKTVLYLEKGELIPLKDDSNNRLWNQPRFVTRSNLSSLPSLFEVVEYDDPNKSDFELLVQWQKSNVEDPNQPGRYSKVAYGPLLEETLSPIQSVVSPENSTVALANSGFLRNDSLLVLIPLTDASSSDQIDPVALFNDLKASRENDILMVGLLCPLLSEDVQRSRACRRTNPDNPNSQMEDEAVKVRKFISAARESLPEERRDFPAILDIGTDDWGEKLAQIGTDIKKQVLQKQIPLGEIAPQWSPIIANEDNVYKSQGYLIEVFYGETMLPNNRDSGWFYNRKTNTITISENISPDLLQQEGAQISVHYIEYHEGPDAEIYDGPAAANP